MFPVGDAISCCAYKYKLKHCSIVLCMLIFLERVVLQREILFYWWFGGGIVLVLVSSKPSYLFHIKIICFIYFTVFFVSLLHLF